MESLASELAQRLITLLAARNLTVSTAESCTGGQLAAAITSVPGSSAVFIGGIVAYANSVKAALLEVPEAVLQRHGAVSAECAAAMASGCQHGFATDFALSTTGIAGPDGGTPEKPVGLVYFGWARRGDSLRVEGRQFTGDRASVQRQSVEHSLRILLELLDAA
jgi:nicotinamide-nucleotide amidase